MKRIAALLIGVTLLAGCQRTIETDIEQVKEDQALIQQCEDVGGTVTREGIGDRLRCRLIEGK